MNQVTQRYFAAFGLLALSGMLVACNPARVAEVLTPTPSPTSTPVRFVPSITPLPTPTDVPEVTPPTDVPDPTVTPTPTRDPNDLFLTMSPNLGPAGQSVSITGQGFIPDSIVKLYWTTPGKKPGQAAFREVGVHEDGTFEVSVSIPEASAWPGGPPAEHDFIELRAIGDLDRQAWATYGFTSPPPGSDYVSPGGTYTNATYGYAIDLPPNWTANDGNTANVTFGPDGETHASFIRVLSEADMDAAIDQLMNEVASGEAFDKQAGKLGTLDGVQVTVTSTGAEYWFVAGNGVTFALHFETGASSAQYTYETFRFTS